MFNIILNFIFQVWLILHGMRQLVSIPLIVVILFTGITVNLASHYCGGTFIDSKISLDGRLTSCGMEPSIPVEPGINNTDHDCQDFISAYTFNGNYLPSNPEDVNLASDLHYENTFCTTIHVEQPDNNPNTSTRPPGIFATSGIKLEVICIFLI